MPWKDRTVMDERIRFVARLLEGESMALLCREFDISRKTGYKIFDRYKERVLEGISDRTRRPHRYGNQLPVQVETAILTSKQDKPHWGARKIREKLLRRFSSEVKVPARSTIHAVLDRHGLVKRMRHRRGRAQGTALSLGQQPNELWCTDYKGEFLLVNQKYCYPLNNGIPFASGNSLFNLSRLSVWWLRLGIGIEGIRPGHPQQNGRHERMHLTLKKEATLPPGLHSLQQQGKFDNFIEEFNQDRPHEGLGMKCPAEVYRPSTRPYRGLPDLIYPFHDNTVHVTRCGRICLHRKKINLSTVFAGQAVGLKEVEEGTWLVSFMDYDLGYIDLEEKTLQPRDSPFGPKVLPMS